MQLKDQNRRSFIKGATLLLTTCGCGAVASELLSSCENFVQNVSPSSGTVIEVNINTEPPDVQENLNRIGWGVLKAFKKVNYGIPVILVRIEENTFVCFSAMCTHAHCIIHKPIDELPAGKFDIFQYIKCNCHGSQFDPYNKGMVVKEPAERPLKEYPVTFNPSTNILKITF